LSRPRVLVAEPLSEAGLEILRAACDVDEASGADRAELLERIVSSEGLVVRSATKVDAELLAAGPRLRVVGRAGVGVDNVDVPEATRRGIVVCNAPQSNSVSAAEHTVALMLALARHVPQADAALRDGRWERSRFSGVELADKTLGLLGFGRIGQLVAGRARGLGMRVIAYDPYVGDERFRDLGVTRVERPEDVYEGADFISLHLPLTPETRHAVDARALASFRPGARLVNAARGDLVDTDALVEALRDGRLAGAAIDVFEQEPLTSSPLFELSNAIVTPHLAASTAEAQDRAGLVIAEQVVAALRGASVRYALNIPHISEEDLEVLGPFVPLAEKLGRLAMSLARGRVERIEIATAGQLAGRDMRLLTLAALRGAFQGRVDDVNDVNARSVAEHQGIEVREQTRAGASDYTNLVAVTARDGDDATVVGTTLGLDNRPWLVRALGYEVEIQLDPRMLVLENADVPGMIGKVGTQLGAAGVNIANMNVSRNSSGGVALMVVSVDQDPPEELLDALEQTEGVASRPRFIRLD
jgi:D-3-phosphoglycerate dehydrogenase / 2-oxoglutarate reductase